jgi:hypothetical protein
MSHDIPNCKIEYKKDINGKIGTYCQTHGGVRICNVCRNNKEAHYIGPKLSHSQADYEKAEKEISDLTNQNK